MSSTATFICLATAAVVLLAACSTDPSVPSAMTHAPAGTGANETIYVLDSGWHSGLVINRDELGPRLTTLLQPPPRARYLMFGWGNRKFYMTPDPTLGMYLGALFPSNSTVLVEACNRSPRACYTKAVKIMAVTISPEGQKRLDKYLLDTFRTNAAGRPDPLDPGPDPESEFYASPLRYDAFHTCNTWTAHALHAAGLRIAYHGVIFAGQLWQQLHPAPA